MTFDTEPAWMQAARKVPLRSTWESRQPSDGVVRHEPNNEARTKPAPMR